VFKEIFLNYLPVFIYYLGSFILIIISLTGDIIYLLYFTDSERLYAKTATDNLMDAFVTVMLPIITVMVLILKILQYFE